MEHDGSSGARATLAVWGTDAGNMKSKGLRPVGAGMSFANQ